MHKLPVRFQFISSGGTCRFTLTDFEFVLEPNADHRLVFELPGFKKPVAISVFEIVTADECSCWVSCETMSFKEDDEVSKLFDAFNKKYGGRITDVEIVDLRKGDNNE